MGSRRRRLRDQKEKALEGRKIHGFRVAPPELETAKERVSVPVRAMLLLFNGNSSQINSMKKHIPSVPAAVLCKLQGKKSSSSAAASEAVAKLSCLLGEE